MTSKTNAGTGSEGDRMGRTHSYVPRRHSSRRLRIPGSRRQRHERRTAPIGNVSGATNLSPCGRRWPSIPVAHAPVRAAATLSTNLGASCWKYRGNEVAHAPVRAASPLSTNLGASCWKHRGNEVAHALLRAASALGPTPRYRKNVECRQECRHGTQECVRHQNPRPSDLAGHRVCGATNLCGKRRRVGRLKIGRRMKSCPTTDIGPPVLPTTCLTPGLCCQ